MTIKELKEKVLGEIKQNRELANGHKANGAFSPYKFYDGKANAYNDVYQTLCIYFKEEDK